MITPQGRRALVLLLHFVSGGMLAMNDTVQVQGNSGLVHVKGHHGPSDPEASWCCLALKMLHPARCSAHARPCLDC